ncbi:RNA polymerase sigma factor [Pedobacter hiemivivus]|nr:RNA polymerase sigma-70 factor [Pedobacter hiemivivus]
MSNYSIHSEKELIELLQQDNTSALSSLYYSHVKQLKYFIQKAAKSPTIAEDVVHDTFIKVWENRMQIDSEQPFKPYLYTIARRHLLNLMKRANQESYIVEEIRKHSISEDNSTEQLLEYNESNSLYSEAINSLPTQCREIFVRCKIQGQSYKQTATELGIAESTVNNQMTKALKSIREFITLRNAMMVILACIVK